MNQPITGQPQSASSQTTTALVLSILGVLCCGFLAPVAWYLANQEEQAIREGRSPAAGQGMATAAKILGIIGTVLLALQIVWVVFFGGMTILGGLLSHH